jgi:hypothetical protein
MGGAYGLAMSWTSLLLAATETPFNMPENDNGWVECLLGSVDDLTGRKQEAVTPRVPEFPYIGVRGVENTSYPVDTSSAGRI